MSLRLLSCLALAVSAAGTLRASSVPCVCFGARHALRPRQAFHALTFAGVSVLGSGKTDTVPACVQLFRGCIAYAGCGSCLRLALFPGYASGQSFGPAALLVFRFLSFRPATLGFGQLVRLFHSSLSLLNSSGFPPDLEDFHLRTCTPSPSAPPQPSPLGERERRNTFVGNSCVWLWRHLFGLRQRTQRSLCPKAGRNSPSP